MLPLLLGVAVGAGAVVAVNNNKEIKEKVVSGATVVKDNVEKSAKKVKEKFCETKDSVKAKIHDATAPNEAKVIEEKTDDK